MLPNEQASKAPQSILDFASHLETVLNHEVSIPPENFPDFSIYLEALPLPRKALAPGQRVEFDHAGLVDIASKVIEQLAPKQEDLLKSAEHDDPHIKGITESLKAQYLLLRIGLAWKQERTELAEHFYAQLEAIRPHLGPSRIGELLDLCYEIGNDQLNQKKGTLAAKWLKRGCQLANEYAAQAEDMDILDLRFTLMHTCGRKNLSSMLPPALMRSAVRALLATEDPQAGHEAFQILHALRQEFGHKLPVILLQLEVYAKDPSPNPDAFSAELMKIVRSAPLIHSNHKFTSDAIRVLESYIVIRLAPSDEDTWTENAIITLIWLMTAESNDSNIVDPSFLEGVFDEIQRAWNKALSAEATHGALVLFWKRIEHTFEHGLKETTSKWCHVTLHRLFSNAGDNNIGKIERKIVKCHIDLHNLDAAHAVLEKMSPARKQHALSRYLRYCLALRRGDEADARSTLASLATVHDNRNKLLFAAVSEATQYGSKFQGAQLLQRILDKYNDNVPPEIDAYALLRCTARLLLLAVSEANGIDEELLSRLCGIFKSAALFTQKQQERERMTLDYRLQESRWFEKTSYNTAVQYLKSWPAKYVIDLLHYSCQHILEAEAKYIQAILYTIEARPASTSYITDVPKTAYSSRAPPQSPAEIKFILYRNVIAKYTEIHAHRKVLHESYNTGIMTEELLEAITQKLIVLAPLAFEAVLFMAFTSQTDIPGQAQVLDELSLTQIVDQMVQLNPPQKTYSIFAHMILSASTGSLDQDSAKHMLPISVTTNLLAKLISGLRNHPDYDNNQAARWMRCVVQIVLDWRGSQSHQTQKDSTRDGKHLSTVARITEHALDLARSAPSRDYPPEELEWLAATLFNLSIDLYASSPSSNSESAMADGVEQNQEIKHEKKQSGDPVVMMPQFWAKRAIDIADVLAMNSAGGGDGGLLAKVLRERCQRLQWDV
ncbi:uncharacterized protein Z519_07254 [Cladophialophora bantiana CBS 173.52]|uniref:Protein ZIP4 homolog n=1 Tax=Cladophialophora bantiana (strain ATCC 10958 / CBS 173.52 / CDC B-1940 / NIH 8579) TaxID=1442370 RepID=A0A0D2HN57_CLAB1|nr:uncharacterized protein Z519_07254 [Cladophialophora bantiana CBS 173.52]KIW92270.1 hypothetical protein Z519_07254 [Cladophialophora bantiana CBS 173.52]